MTPTLLLALPSPDWHQMFVPSVSPLELVIRGSIMYLAILAAMRMFRRQAGSLNTADLLVVVLVADAAQNGMASEYHSVTDGLVLIGTIYAWNYLLDVAAFRWRPVHRLINPPPLPLVRDGQVVRRNLRQEMLTARGPHGAAPRAGRGTAERSAALLPRGRRAPERDPPEGWGRGGGGRALAEGDGGPGLTASPCSPILGRPACARPSKPIRSPAAT